MNQIKTKYLYHLITKTQSQKFLTNHTQKISVMGNKVDFTKNQDLMHDLAYHNSHFFKMEKVTKTQYIKFPLSTKHAAIVDENGKRVKLMGANWSGGHMSRHCVDGLECRPIDHIATELSGWFGLNCIRLCYSLQMFYDDNVVPESYIQANPQLYGKTAMQIFDITVETLTKNGLMVILNNHTSKSQWCCSNDDGDGLWWSREYPEYMFFECAEHMANRYKNNPRVIGMDLRNELRKAHGVDTEWGNCNPRNDWSRASKICAERVLKIAPHWLIFVSGLNYQLDFAQIANKPLELSVPNKLVYTGHYYAWSWGVRSWSSFKYNEYEKKMFNTQTFVRSKGIPFLLGEFGDNTRNVSWQYTIKYLQENDIDWTYWCLDGFKCVRSDDQTYGLYSNNFSQIRNPELFADLSRIIGNK